MWTPDAPAPDDHESARCGGIDYGIEAPSGQRVDEVDERMPAVR
jgi:hypothetical protein